MNSCNDNPVTVPQISIKYQLYGPRTTHCIVRTPQEVYGFVGYTYGKKITNRGHERVHQCGTSWLLMIFCFCCFCHGFLDFIGYFHVVAHSRALVATASVETCPSTPRAKSSCFQGAATPVIGCLWCPWTMAPDCAIFYTIFGYFWLNLSVYFYFRKSVWLESAVGLFKQKLSSLGAGTRPILVLG